MPAERPGFYRVDLRIKDLDNSKGVTYRQYFQVLRRSVVVVIAVSTSTVPPGESVYVRVFNRGGG